jgi:probable rRNA maturation factor
MTQPTGLDVLLLNRQRRSRVRPRRLRRVLEGAARALSIDGEVSLVLTGDRAVRALNARYRGKDRPTDVLSFPAAERRASWATS